MATTGYLRESILWHLASTGGATAPALARLIGTPQEYIKPALRRMRASGQLTDRRNCPGLLELTVKGIDAARAVDVSQVETAAPEAIDAPSVVPPERFDLMRATAYRPDPGPALRPGAMDYKRCPTVGLRC